MIKTFRIKVTGKVQGVCYRISTQREAVQLQLGGFTCNEPDGSVKIEAEGEEADLDTLLQWCRKGPQLAEVGRVDFEEIPRKSYTHFEIRYE